VRFCHRTMFFYGPDTYRIVKLQLSVHYPDEYPDTLPRLTLQAIEGELEEEEHDALLESLTTVVCDVYRRP
jgi:hypothetical protein